MKFPKTCNRYCPFCKKHTEHSITQAKKRTPGSTHPMSHGSKLRIQKRGKCTGYGNLGKLSKGAMGKWKRYGKKSSKKTDFRYECKVCKKKHTQRKGFRTKKIEFK